MLNITSQYARGNYNVKKIFEKQKKLRISALLTALIT